MQRPFHHIVLLFAALFAAPWSAAQPVPALLRTLGPAEGLSQSSVQTMIQDGQGLIWLGTQDGLDRYDGYSVITYRADPLDPSALQAGSITALLEDREGRIWVGTEGGGLARMNREDQTFRTWKHDPADSTSLSSDYIFGLAEDDDGTIWIATSDEGLNRLDGDRITRIPDTRYGLFDVVWQSGVGLWLATDGAGLVLYAGGNPTTIWPMDGDDNLPIVIDIDLAEDGTLWVAAVDGLFRIDPGTQEVAPVSVNAEFEPVMFAVHEDRQGRIWAGTAEDGAYILRPGSDAFVALPEAAETVDRIAESTVYSILEDRSGIVWLGTESRGAQLFGDRGVEFASLDAAGGYPEFRDVWSVLEGRDGSIWAGVDAGLVRYAGSQGGVSTITFPRSVQGGIALALHERPSGDIWAALDYGGMVVRSADGNVAYDPMREELADGDSMEVGIMTFFEDPDATLWMGSAGWGLYRLEAGETLDARKHIALAPDSLDEFNAIFHIEPAPDGRLWMTTEGGLVVYDPDTGDIRRISSSAEFKGGLASADLFALCFDRDETLWIGSANGLFSLSAEEQASESPRFERMDEEDGLPNYVIYSVLPDSSGWIWMSTNRGLAAMDPERRVVRTFDTSDGLPGLEYNSSAFGYAKDGRLLFGGIDGLSIVPASPAAPSRYSPQIVITKASTYDRILGVDLPADARVDLRYPDRNIALEFAALDYARPWRIRYAYQLNPLDERWIDIGEERTARFANLAPGTYTFSVRATNSDGIHGMEIASAQIVVTPRFWQTLWFRLALILTVLSVAGLVARRWFQSRMRSQQARIQAQQMMNERLEGERMRLARELHDGPIQQLQLVGFELRSLAHDLTDAQVPTVDAAWGSVRESIAELRDICGDLRPPALVHFGLGRAIRSHSERFLEQHPDVEIELAVNDNGTLLSERMRLNLFRIYQEAMRNVAKHAGACEVQVRLTYGDDQVELVVEDNGPGFDLRGPLTRLAEHQHYGLIGMVERAETIGGTVRIKSKSGEGARLVVVAPITPAES